MGNYLEGKETILVVEDNPMVQYLIAEVLTRQGYRILEATEGEEALVMCEKEKDPIDLILIDIVMPHMGGLELIELLRQVRKDFKVLYMTGNIDEMVVHHNLLKEGVNIVQKPFTVEELSRRVRGVLNEN